MKRLLAVLVATAMAAGCGSRGDPLAPLRPIPGALAGVEIAQIGNTAVFRFDPPPTSMFVADRVEEVDRIEVLLLSERYAAVTSETLAVALDRERQVRLALAREAADIARTEAEERRRAAEIQAALDRAEGPPAAEVPDPDAALDTGLSEDELLLQQVPSNAIQAWLDGGLDEIEIIEAARHLDAATDELWTELGMPIAIIDLLREPALPDPRLVIEAAQRVSAIQAYESRITPEDFLERATVVYQIPILEIGDYLEGSKVRVEHALTGPGAGAVRTRHTFAVRVVTRRNHEGALGPLASLAPTAVPVAPTALSAIVLPTGVQLAWQPPTVDILGDELTEEAIEYNVYRADRGALGTTPLNFVPLDDSTYVDTTVQFGSRYAYEVRAARAALGTVPVTPVVPVAPALPAPRKESAGAIAGPMQVEDVFPPPSVSALEAVRAGERITLRWTPAVDLALAGYRVYRHAAPAPEIPGLVIVDVEETDDEEQGEDAETPALPVEPPTVDQQAEIEATAEQQAATEATAESAETQEADPDATEATTTRQRRRPNLMIEAGWELLTSVPLSDARYVDPLAATDIDWVYVVEALDAAGNVSVPQTVTVEKNP